MSAIIANAETEAAAFVAEASDYRTSFVHDARPSWGEAVYQVHCKRTGKAAQWGSLDAGKRDFWARAALHLTQQHTMAKAYEIVLKEAA